MRFVIDREEFVAEEMAAQGRYSTSFRCNFEVGVLDIVSREEYLRASKIFRNAITKLHNEYGVVVESESPEPSVEMPEPTGPVILEGPFVKPSEPAQPKDLHCEVPELPHTIVCKPDQVEDAKSIIQSAGSDTVTEFVTPLQEPSQVEHDVGPEPEEPEPTESEKLATEFENRCFDEVTSPETAAKLWEEYKTRIASHGDAYRKQRATSLVMAVVDHNKELTVPEAAALIQTEVKKLNTVTVAKTPEVEQTEKPAEDISALVQKFVDACKEFEGKPNVSESEIFRLLAVNCATPLPDRKVNPTKAFAVLDGATTLHKVPLLVKAFPDMEAAKEKIIGDASKTKKFSMMCAAAKIQIER